MHQHRGLRVELFGMIALAFLIGQCTRAHGQDQAQAGAEIYAEKCQECHGERMVSTGAAFDLRQLKPDERPRFNESVTNGKGQMPAWGGMLTDTEMDQIWAYIRSRADR